MVPAAHGLNDFWAPWALEGLWVMVRVLAEVGLLELIQGWAFQVWDAVRGCNAQPGAGSRALAPRRALGWWLLGSKLGSSPQMVWPVE